MSCDGNCESALRLRAQLAAVEKERDEYRGWFEGKCVCGSHAGDDNKCPAHGPQRLRIARDAANARVNALEADLARERDQAQSCARMLLVEQERRAKLEAALEARLEAALQEQADAHRADILRMEAEYDSDMAAREKRGYDACTADVVAWAKMEAVKLDEAAYERIAEDIEANEHVGAAGKGKQR